MDLRPVVQKLAQGSLTYITLNTCLLSKVVVGNPEVLDLVQHDGFRSMHLDSTNTTSNAQNVIGV